MHINQGAVMKNRNLPVEDARIRGLLAVGCPVPAERPVLQLEGSARTEDRGESGGKCR
jgi:hypothetical protein